MTISLVEDLRATVTPDLMAGAATALAVPENAAVHAIGSSTAAILATLARMASNPEALDAAAAVLGSPGNDGTLLDDMRPVFSISRAGGLATVTGARLNAAILGPRSEPLKDAIRDDSGLPPSAVEAAMEIGGTLIATITAKHLRLRGDVSTQSLRELLTNQREEIDATVPAYLSAALSSVGGRSSHEDRPAKAMEPRLPAASTANSPGRRARIALLLAAASVGGLWWMNATIGKQIDLWLLERTAGRTSATSGAQPKASVETEASKSAKSPAQLASEKVAADARRAAELRSIVEARAAEVAEAARRTAVEAEAAAARANEIKVAAKAAADAKAVADAKVAADMKAAQDAAAAEKRATEARAAAKAAADAKAAAEVKLAADLKAAQEATQVQARAAEAARQQQAARAAAEAAPKPEITKIDVPTNEPVKQPAAAAEPTRNTTAPLANVANVDPPAPPAAGLAGMSPASRLAIAKACQETIMEATRSGSIRFRTASATITPETAATLNRVSTAMKACPTLVVRIEAHTDAAGNPTNNKQLSQARAKAVAAYLSSTGIAAETMTPIGIGDARPLVPNTSEANRIRNRRIEFIAAEE